MEDLGQRTPKRRKMCLLEVDSLNIKVRYLLTASTLPIPFKKVPKGLKTCAFTIEHVKNDIS